MWLQLFTARLNIFTSRRGESGASIESKMLAQGRWVTPGYFATLRIPVIAGELCPDRPNTTATMVNRSFANRYFNGLMPIGRHLVMSSNPYLPPGEIRGIVGDVRETGLDQEPPPTVYWCAGTSQPGTYFLVRIHGEPHLMAGSIRQRIHELEPQRSVYDLTPLTDHISDAYAEHRMRTVLFAFFALTAVSLAALGIYGTLGYVVAARRREVALRMALGALRTQVVRQFLYLGLRVALLGCAGGVVLALSLSQLLAGMLYGVSATDGATMAGVVVFVLAVSALAALFPAIRAARLDPTQLLREQ